MLLLLALACAPERHVDPSLALELCEPVACEPVLLEDGPWSYEIEVCDTELPADCEAVLLDDARWVGRDTEATHVAQGLRALLSVSPEWYADTLGSWRALDSGPAVDGEMASARGKRVTVHGPLLWSPETLAAVYVHEAAHAAHPETADHVPCGWSPGLMCDDGDATDGYPMSVTFLEDAGWTDDTSIRMLEQFTERAGW